MLFKQHHLNIKDDGTVASADWLLSDIGVLVMMGILVMHAW